LMDGDAAQEGLGASLNSRELGFAIRWNSVSFGVDA